MNIQSIHGLTSTEKMARISYANAPSFGSGAGKLPEPPQGEPTFRELMNLCGRATLNLIGKGAKAVAKGAAKASEKIDKILEKK